MTTQEKEFLTTPHDLDPVTNFSRILKSSSLSTILFYCSKFASLSHKIYLAKGNILDLEKTISQKRNDGKLQYSTLRTYKSCILFSLGYLIARQNGTPMPEVGLKSANTKRLSIADDCLSHLIDVFPTDDLHACYLKTYHWKAEITALKNTLNTLALQDHNSSSKKAKKYPERLKKAVIRAITDLPKTKSHIYIAYMLELNSILGLRPKEWLSAVIITKEPERNEQENLERANRIYGLNLQPNTYWLKVKNGKASQNRSCGEYRYIGLKNLPSTTLNQLQKFLLFFKTYFPINPDDPQTDQEKIYQKFDNFLSRTVSPSLIKIYQQPQIKKLLKPDPDTIKAQAKTQKVLNSLSEKDTPETLSKKAKIPNSLIQTNHTIYSTRHQAIANAKRHGMNPIEIASIFGHISIITASRHYGKARNGNIKKPVLCANLENVNIVISNLSENAKDLLYTPRDKPFENQSPEQKQENLIRRNAIKEIDKINAKDRAYAEMEKQQERNRKAEPQYTQEPPTPRP